MNAERALRTLLHIIAQREGVKINYTISERKEEHGRQDVCNGC